MSLFNINYADKVIVQPSKITHSKTNDDFNNFEVILSCLKSLIKLLKRIYSFRLVMAYFPVKV